MSDLNAFLSHLNWRYATKNFDPSKKIPEATFKNIIEAGRLSPSSYGLQPWKFLVITDPAVRAKLREKAWNQPQLTEASHVIVLCGRTDIDEKFIASYIEDIAKTRGVTTESLEGFKGMLLEFLPSVKGEAGKAWVSNQVYIALGVLLSACAEAEVDACPMEGFDRDAFNEVLGLKEKNLTSLVLCAAGYRSPQDKYSSLKKVRRDVASVVAYI